MNAFSFISDLIYWLARWVPQLFIVQATHAAVKFRHGKKIIPLAPGLHIYWPAVTRVERLAVVRQTLNLPTQIIQCAADKCIAVSGVVVFEIRDVEAALGRSWDVNETIEDLALTGILQTLAGDRVSRVVTEIQDGSLTKLLTDTLRKKLRKYGVYVQYCSLTDLATARVIHMSGGAGVVPTEDHD